MLRTAFLAIGLLLMGCHAQQEEYALGISDEQYYYLEVDESIEIEPPSTTEPPPPPEFLMEKGSKIIKDGNMKFEVTNLERSKKKVDTLLQAMDGYYEMELYNSYGSRITYTLHLRIPNEKFDSAIFLIESGLGKLKSKNITSQDVTDEFVDINIRLKNKISYLNQYKTILSKAKTIKEILEVQQKIRRLEEEIESKKGRLKYLNNRIRYSSLNLELSELISEDLSSNRSFDIRILNAFKSGVHGLQNAIIAIVNFWPILLTSVLLVLGGRPVYNHIRRRNSLAD